MTDVSISYAALPVTRKAAKLQLTKFYFTGKPCVRGHVDRRVTICGGCYQCKLDDATAWKKRNQERMTKYQQARSALPEVLVANAARQKKKRQADPDTYNASRREYRANNVEKARGWNATYNGKNRETLRIKASKYYYANLDERRAANRAAARADPELTRRRVREWQKANPELARALQAQYRARKKGAAGRYTAADVAELHKWQDGNCAACQRNLLETGYHVDHIVPLSKGGSNWQSNLQLLCPLCNTSKRASDYAEWIALRRREGFIPE